MIELIVAVAIIAILVAISMPAIQVTRETARCTVCLSNLRQIGLTNHRYRDLRNGALPTSELLGGWQYRMAPGLKSPNKSALPESYGLEALYVQMKLLPTASGIWTCASQPESMLANKNTYAFSTATIFETPRKIKFLKKEPLAWDNYTMRPGLSGVFMKKPTGYNIPIAEREPPHTLRGGPGYNMLFLDNHCETLQ